MTNHDDMKQQWLMCVEIVPGMFTNERVITVERLGGIKESFFVPQSEVREEESCLVRVQVTRLKTCTLIVLPTAERDCIAVDAALLVAE